MTLILDYAFGEGLVLEPAALVGAWLFGTCTITVSYSAVCTLCGILVNNKELIVNLFLMKVWSGLQPSWVRPYTSEHVDLSLIKVWSGPHFSFGVAFALTCELYLHSSTSQNVWICLWWRYTRTLSFAGASYKFFYISACEKLSLIKEYFGLRL